MYVLRWIHTRKKVPRVKEFSSYGEAWLFVAYVRYVYPGHVFALNGEEI